MSEPLDTTAYHCGACAFWDKTNALVGECRRLSPRALVYVGNPSDRLPQIGWPRTVDDDWCGDYRPHSSGDSGDE